MRVVVVPDPNIFPGLMVHAPVAGNPFNTTLPVGSEHVGCVMDPTVGAGGVAGTVFITTSTEVEEVHPASLVTVKLYVPAPSPETVLLVPEPVIEPGLIVHVPVPGSPFNITLPVTRAQVG